MICVRWVPLRSSKVNAYAEGKIVGQLVEIDQEPLDTNICGGSVVAAWRERGERSFSRYGFERQIHWQQARA